VRLILFLLLGVSAFAQKPTNPALMIPQNAPELDYAAVADPLPLPPGVTIGAPAAVGFDSKGYMLLLNRGPQAFAEFDASGKFIRMFGDGLLVRAHGLRIDKADNLWVTDVNAHVVMKLNRQGEVLLTLGTKGEAGEWNESTGSHRFNQPTDLALGRNGDTFVVQGHTPDGGDPRVLKFDKNGKFIKTWGGKGTEPGKFAVAHGIAIDAKGLLWVADRENQRVQVFDQDGKYIREMKYAGLPCSLSIGARYVYMVNGYGGQVLRLDLDGKVLDAVGKSGKGTGEFGEAHALTVGPTGEIWVADSVNSAVQKFVKR
jgi:DNA-binding beta-propeller fold protein YncE